MSGKSNNNKRGWENVPQHIKTIDKFMKGLTTDEIEANRMTFLFFCQRLVGVDAIADRVALEECRLKGVLHVVAPFQDFRLVFKCARQLVRKTITFCVLFCVIISALFISIKFKFKLIHNINVFLNFF